MAYHFNTRIEIIEERDNGGPEAGFYEEVTIAKPWADIRRLKAKNLKFGT